MKSTASRAPGGRVVLDVEVAPEEMTPDVEQTYRRLAREVRIPGFRPGRAPHAIVERVLGRERVRRELLDALLNRAYRSALDEQRLVPLDQPQVEVREFEDGGPLRFQATVSVRPVVQLGDYRSIRLPREVPPVTAEDVDRALEELRAVHGTWVPVEDAPVAEGHLVIVDTVGTVEDGRRVEERRVGGVVGTGRLRPEIDAAVRGLAVGGSTEVAVRFAETDARRDLAGKSARVQITVLEIKRAELPPLDDAFAALVTPGSTLDGLRADVASRLQASAERQADQALAAKALQAAVDAATVEVPEVMVARVVDNLVADLGRQLTEAGSSLDQYLQAEGKTLESLREELRPTAERQAKTELVIDAIAEDAELVPTLREMEAEIAALGRSSGMSPAAFQRLARQPEHWAAIRFTIMQRRVLRMLAALASGASMEEAVAGAVQAGPGTDEAGAAPVSGNPLDDAEGEADEAVAGHGEGTGS
jgi:trigger factor